MPVRRISTLRLLPHLADGLVTSADRHGLKLGTLAGILVWNDSLQPSALEAEPRGKLSRVPIPCPIRPAIARLIPAALRRTRLNRNAYLEALVAAHMAKPGPLVVHSRSAGNL